MSHSTPAPAYTLPTIHLNGTGGRALADEYCAFWQELDKAAAVLSAATCNARDFYPQEPGSYIQACRERQEAFRKLKDLQAYAQAWMEQASAHL